MNQLRKTPVRGLGRAAGWVLAAMSLVFVAALSGVVPAGASGYKALTNPFPAPPDTGKPVQGGTLTIGMAGGGTSDSLDPEVLITSIDPVRAYALYDTLTSYTSSGKIHYDLATSITPDNSSNLDWTIHLRPNVRFSDGSTLTAQDVLYSWNRIVSNDFPGDPALADINLTATHAVDPLTIDVVCNTPMAVLPELMTNDTLPIVKNGFTDFAHGADGTGPFTFVSWTPGQQSVFVRNPYYWGHKANVAKLVIDDLSSETAVNNALASGQINMALFMAPSGVQVVKQNSSRLYLAGQVGQAAPNFYLRTDEAPFNNPAVVKAMKLAINRKLCVASALDGYGSVANDLYGYDYPDYDHSLPQRPYDPSEAKAILAKAGIKHLTVTLTVGDAFPGMVSCAEVYQQSAAAAGITIKIHEVPGSEVFDESTVYLKVPFGMSDWEGNSFEAQALQTLTNGAAFNETHFSGPEQVKFQSLFTQALGTSNPVQRQKLLNEAQEIAANDSGQIVWGFALTLNGFSKQVHGVAELDAPSRGYRTFGLNYVWLSK